MKFLMTKAHLVEALTKMNEVATKGIKADYEKAHRVTIKVEDDKVNFLSSNGLLDAHWEVTTETDSNLKCEKKGSATVDVPVARRIAASIGGGSVKDNIIAVSLQGDASPALHMKDADAKSKKLGKMVTCPDGHNFTISKPRSGFSYTFESEELQRGVATSAKYVAKRNYLPRYMMMCLHFLKDQTRFVCGDGSRFGILSFKFQDGKLNANIEDDSGKKFIMPCDQAQIIANVCSDACNIEMIYKNEQTCYIKPQSALTLLLHGIPNDQYISYEKHAFNFDDAELVVDVQRSDFEEGMLLIGAVEDKEQLEQGGFHHCDFEIKDGRANFVVREARYQADFDCEATTYSDGEYASCYAWAYLRDVAQATDKSIVRFYCIDPERTIIAEPVEPDDGAKNEMGIPGHKKDTDNPKLSFFFAAASDEEEE